MEIFLEKTFIDSINSKYGKKIVEMNFNLTKIHVLTDNHSGFAPESEIKGKHLLHH